MREGGIRKSLCRVGSITYGRTSSMKQRSFMTHVPQQSGMGGEMRDFTKDEWYTLKPYWTTEEVQIS